MNEPAKGDSVSIPQTTKASLDPMPTKKTFLSQLGKFMLYGGWMLLLVLALVLMILFSHK